MKTYAYIRVSCDKQSTKTQKYEITKYAKDKNIIIDKWIEETISGTKKVEDRKLGNLLKKMDKGDTLIISEMSRLSRNLMGIMAILNSSIEKRTNIIAIKENFHLSDNINSKVLAFAFALSAEIERNLISLRTKEAIARKKAEGCKIGRPKGGRFSKLIKNINEIKQLISEGCSKRKIKDMFGVSRSTLYNFLKEQIQN